ncbi:Sel1 repeat protein [Polaromonas sp. CF318]|uniref:SEL1-like repeat protein n=1 Tax=Polaromonas sp. CF318 TaxID=1144318 RepID=UPI000271102B|nr:tetratricopeptide repeat protein [Polaromonas sp. CF318]EJL83626.1 Sel1 repeat protein [Polaromonas sp. CF318]
MIKKTAHQRAARFSIACILAVALQMTYLLAFAQAGAAPNAQIAPRLDQVSKMLAGAASRDANAVWDAKTEIEELPYPARGDRKLARRLNTTALDKFKADQVAEALADFEKARRADPSDQEIANNYGYVLYRAGKLPEAEAQLRYTLALAPARAAAWANLAEVLGAQGQAPRAADAFVVSHRFSRNPDTTRQYIEKFAASTTDPAGLTQGAAQALSRLFPAAGATGTAAALAQPLAGTTAERNAAAQTEMAAAAGTAAPTAAVNRALATAATDAAKAVPVAQADPLARLLSQLPNPEVVPLFSAAAKGSASAREDLLRLAHGGNARAQHAVAMIYNNGRGVEVNHELANTWYRKSAEAGFVLAQAALAWNQQHGIGMAADLPLAFDNYRRAAEQGHPYAMNNLALMYYRGMGTRPDVKASFDWFVRAAEAGLARGAHNAAWYLEYGVGQPADLRKAFAYHLSAATAGFAQSQYKVGHAYEYGWGGSQDRAAAIDWYKKAALQGLEPAKDALKRLGVTDI